MPETAYQRVLLKLSGEVLAGEEGFGIDPAKATQLAVEVKSIHDLGIDIGLVIGAGNILEVCKLRQRACSASRVIILVCWQRL